MKKVIRLTEGDLVNIVKRVIEEQGIGNLYKLFTSKSVVKPLIKSKPLKSAVGSPLTSQLSSKVTSVLYKLPTKIKIGPKLSDVFSKSKNNVISLEGSLGNIADSFSEFDMSHNLMTKIKKTMFSPKGSVINLKELYQDIHLVKKDLENLKNVIKSKKSSSLNKMNVKDVEKFFWGKETDINKIIYNLDELIKNNL